MDRLFNEQSGKLTMSGFVKVCEAIGKDVAGASIIGGDEGQYAGEVLSNSGQVVTYALRYSIDRCNVELRFKEFSGYRLTLSGELVCDMTLDLDDRWNVMWEAARIATEQLEMISAIVTGND